MILPILTYNAESWTHTPLLLRKLQSFYRTKLITICGRDYLTSMDELLMITNMPTLEDFLTDKRLAWLGHIIKQGGDKLLQEALNENRERNGAYWQHIEKDLEKIGLFQWEQVLVSAKDKGIWASLLSEFRERMLPRFWAENPDD